MKQTNLCFLVQPGKVLLAMKKRGFGEGKWNGPGGKVQEGETALEAVHREVHEEIGVTLYAPEQRGILEFFFEGNPEWNNQCAIFLAKDFSGDPQESEEMNPRWFVHEEIPYNAMWPDDLIWLSRLLDGEHVYYRFHFDSEGKLLRHEETKNTRG